MDDKKFLRLLNEVGYANWRPKVGDRVQEKFTGDTGEILRVHEDLRGRTLVWVLMDFPEIALCKEWVSTVDAFIPEQKVTE